ncbi:ectoine hydrolase DoeA [Paraburkholderia aspalathi]|uniref:Ectoine hydrolase n=1 Tax=Paraburkholderia aspalathi TaxID=1324617 RepID=A0A1I7BEQ8_9BURK|nr:ectoine hydrolase DoeA [Paraburkholderia aspalathi]SFT85591.1 ectoine hydrolase [Paraburkholderia aspalathi]
MSGKISQTEFPRLRKFFDDAEYLARLEKLRSEMIKRNLGLLIVSDPSNMAWISGYDGYSFYNHQCVVVPLEGEPVWFGRGIDLNGAKATVYMSHSALVGYPEEYVQRDLHPMVYFSNEVIKGRGWENLVVGLELDSFYFSAATYTTLQRELPTNSWRDATGLVNWQRAVKSEAELGYMRVAGRILEKMYDRLLDVIEPGMKKNDLVAEIYATAIRGLDGYGGDYPSIVPIVPTGVEAATPHLTWDDSELKTGFGTFFEIAGVYRRYHCPLSRTVFLGQPPQKFLDAEAAVVEGIEAGLAKAKPGNTCEDIANAFFAVARKHGIKKGGRVGYPIGMSYPPDWGERTMSLRDGDRTVLEPGMTLHFMPGLWFDDWGLEITESIAITQTGVDCLSDVPRKLFVRK